MSTNDGGPAFPVADGPTAIPTSGMSLRDYFAAAALTGLVAHGRWAQSDQHMFARDAYRIADAMLATRTETRHD